MITNRHNLPAPLVSAVANDPYEFDGDISTTTLIGPPRIHQLRKRHRSTISEDASDLIWALVGTNTHAILERVQSPLTLREQRFWVTLNGWKIGGQIDLYDQVDCILSDYKVTSVWSVIHGVKPEWTNQLNVNSWLMEENGYVVEKMQIVAILRDWSKFKAKEKGYPDCQVKVIPIERMADPGGYVMERVALHQAAAELPDDDLPWCTDAERWFKLDTYAVMQEGRKNARRVLYSWGEAADWLVEKGHATKSEAGYAIDSHYSIEFRAGENIRCESYCNVKNICNQYISISEPPF